MAASSGEFFNRYPMDGCLSGSDGIIDQRPYHRNCKCELHNNKSRKHNCPHGGNGKKGSIVSYPIRRSWSEGCLALSSLSSPASSPGAYASPDSSAPPPTTTATKKKMMMVEKHRRGSASDDDADDLFPQMKIKN